MIGLGKDYNKH